MQERCKDGAGGCRGAIADQDRLKQTKADHGRPKHCDIRGANSISDAFFF